MKIKMQQSQVGVSSTSTTSSYVPFTCTSVGYSWQVSNVAQTDCCPTLSSELQRITQTNHLSANLTKLYSMIAKWTQLSSKREKRVRALPFPRVIQYQRLCTVCICNLCQNAVLLSYHIISYIRLRLVGFLAFCLQSHVLVYSALFFLGVRHNILTWLFSSVTLCHMIQ